MCCITQSVSSQNKHGRLYCVTEKTINPFISKSAVIRHLLNISLNISPNINVKQSGQGSNKGQGSRVKVEQANLAITHCDNISCSFLPLFVLNVAAVRGAANSQNFVICNN